MKNLSKAFDKKFVRKIRNQYSGEEFLQASPTDIKNYIRQREKELLDEVKEIVIGQRVGNILGVCLCCNVIRSGEGSVEPHKPACLNDSVEIILKKLKELSNE